MVSALSGHRPARLTNQAPRPDTLHHNQQLLIARGIVAHLGGCDQADNVLMVQFTQQRGLANSLLTTFLITSFQFYDF